MSGVGGPRSYGFFMQWIVGRDRKKTRTGWHRTDRRKEHRSSNLVHRAPLIPFEELVLDSVRVPLGWWVGLNRVRSMSPVDGRLHGRSAWWWLWRVQLFQSVMHASYHKSYLCDPSRTRHQMIRSLPSFPIACTIEFLLRSEMKLPHRNLWTHVSQ